MNFYTTVRRLLLTCAAWNKTHFITTTYNF